jgi:hypothetical protein
MSEVVKETSPTKGLRFGHTTVGVTAVKLCEGFPAKRGILIRCPGSSDPVPNTVCVWVGGVNVKADSTSLGGMPLPPGQAIIIPIDEPGELYVISTAADQDVAWMGV